MANAFDASMCAAAAPGPKTSASLGAQPVGQAERQRNLGTDDDEVDAVHVGRIGDAIDVVGGDGEVGGEFSSTGIARARSR